VNALKLRLEPVAEYEMMKNMRRRGNKKRNN